MAEELARLEQEEEGDLVAQANRALEVIGSTLRLFPPEQIALTFNGGKDAVVVLHLLRIELARQGSQEAGLGAFRVVYFEPKKEFPEISAFMADMAERYRFQYTVYHGSYKEGMEDLVTNEGIKAVLMGVRRGDPFTDGSEHFSPSSPGWPAFMRVYPILRWDYGHIWRFIRALELPYCTLYDRGYTSIGDYSTTVPNAALLLESGEYLPAYDLHDYSLERSNRLRAGGASMGTTVPAKERSKGAIICVGDFLSPWNSKHSALLLLIYSLHYLPCDISPVAVVRKEHDDILHQLHSLPSDLDFLLLMCIDEESTSMAREAIQRQVSRLPCNSPLCLPEPLPAAPPGASSPTPPLLLGGWQQEGPFSSYGNVCILSPHFELMEASDRKAALERVLQRSKALKSLAPKGDQLVID